MPRPIALCLEDLDASCDAERYLRCVALTGRQPGLTLDRDGEVRWQDQAGAPPACELWVSADERLILFRPEGSRTGVTLRRGGRSLELPEGKPVVLLDGDRLQLSQRRLQIHVHGSAPAVHPPEVFVVSGEERRGSSGRLMRAAAAALALGTAVSTGSCKQVEIRDRPPQTPAVTKPDASVKPDTKPPAPKPIEVRDRPPEMAVPEPDPEPPPSLKPEKK